MCNTLSCCSRSWSPIKIPINHLYHPIFSQRAICGPVAGKTYSRCGWSSPAPDSRDTRLRSQRRYCRWTGDCTAPGWQCGCSPHTSYTSWHSLNIILYRLPPNQCAALTENGNGYIYSLVPSMGVYVTKLTCNCFSFCMDKSLSSAGRFSWIWARS